MPIFKTLQQNYMKRLTVFIFLLISFLCTKANVQISGTVFNSSTEYLYYTSPIDGFCNINVENEYKLIYNDSIAKFNLSFEIKSPVFIKIQIDYSPIWLLIQPNDTLQIDIDFFKYQKKDISGLRINGNNSKGQLLYNQIFFEPYNNFIEVINLFDKSVFNKSSFIQSINNICLSQIQPFEKLYKEGHITKDYFTVTSYKLKAAIFSEALKRMNESNSFLTSSSENEKDSLQTTLFSILPPLDTILNKGIFTEFYQYQYAIYLCQKALKKKREADIPDTIISRGGRNYLVSKFYTPFLYIGDKRLQQNVWGKILYQMSLLFKDKVYKDDYKVFSALFPTSEYNKAFAAIEKSNTDELLKTIDSGDVFKTKYLDSLGIIQHIVEIGKILSRKNLIYVDIWASWCLPCRQEFIASKKIDSILLTKYNITKVYISFDDPKVSKANWKEIIKKYQLNGYHILAGTSLKKEILKKIFKSPTNYSIPRYFILNKKGQIIVDDAYRPSEADKLFKQLNHLYN